MRENIKLYWTAFNTALQAKFEYRVDFFVGVLTSCMLQLSSLFFLWIVFHQTPSINGWMPDQVILLFGMTAAALGLSLLHCPGRPGPPFNLPRQFPLFSSDHPARTACFWKSGYRHSFDFLCPDPFKRAMVRLGSFSAIRRERLPDLYRGLGDCGFSFF